MGLLPKQIADVLFQEGKMPEWWYRQHYKTFQENWIDSFFRSQQRNRNFFERRKQEKQEQQNLENQINDGIEKALSKAFSRFSLK